MNDTGKAETHSESIDPIGMRVVWLLLISAFVAILNETTMGVAIPHLYVDLGVDPAIGQFLTSSFMLTMAIVIPTTGFLLQRFTTRQVYLTAMGLFSAGTLACLIAINFTGLLLGRIIQASGTAIMIPLLMTTVMTVVPEQHRGRVMGRAGMVMAVAPAVGPAISGLILDSLNWRWIFAMVLPIALIVLFIGWKWVQNLGETMHKRIDLLSVLLSAAGFGGFVFGISQISGNHTSDSLFTPTVITVLICLSILLLALFIWRQIALQRKDDALLDLRVFTSKNFTFSIITLSILAMAMFGGLTLLPVYLQNVLGLTATESGLVVLPGSILMGVLAPLIGRIFDSFGPRPLLIPGTIAVSVVLWYYTTVSETTSVWLLVTAQTILALGLAMSFTPIFSTSLGSLQPKFYSHGSAILNTMQQVAGAIGVSLLLSTMSQIAASSKAAQLAELAAEAAGVRAAFLIAAIISIFAVVGALFINRTRGASAGTGAALH